MKFALSFSIPHILAIFYLCFFKCLPSIVISFVWKQWNKLIKRESKDIAMDHVVQKRSNIAAVCTGSLSLTPDHNSAWSFLNTKVKGTYAWLDKFANIISEVASNQWGETLRQNTYKTSFYISKRTRLMNKVLCIHNAWVASEIDGSVTHNISDIDAKLYICIYV